MLRQLSYLLLACPLFLAAGCGGSGEYSGPVGQVKGVVHLNGKPLDEEALITFISGEGGFAASGSVDATGNFRIKYNGSYDIPVGKYNVGVSQLFTGGPTSTDPASFFNADGSTKVVEIPKSKIPAKFQQAGSSGIQVEIVEGNDNDLLIDMN